MLPTLNDFLVFLSTAASEYSASTAMVEDFRDYVLISGCAVFSTPADLTRSRKGRNAHSANIAHLCSPRAVGEINADPSGWLT
jgi:hypothetical protein